MLNFAQEADPTQMITRFSTEATVSTAQRREIFERNRHRVYAVAFWMTGSELAAEDLMSDVFRVAFSSTSSPSVDDVDRALVGEIAKTFDIPVFTLAASRPQRCAMCEQYTSCLSRSRGHSVAGH